MIHQGFVNHNRYKYLSYLSIILVVFSILVSRNAGLNRIALYLAIPLAFVCSFISAGNSFSKNRYLRIVILLYLWIGFTILTSRYFSVSIAHISPIVGCVLLCFIVSNLARKPHLIPWIYLAYSLLLVEAIIYTKNNILVLGYDISSARADDENLNANTLSYYLFYATIAFYIVRDYFSNKSVRKFFSILFLLMVPVSFFVAIIAASRQALIIQIPLLTILIWIRYFVGTKVTTKIFAIVCALIAYFVASDKIMSTYDNSYLSSRNEGAYEEDIRVVLIKEAIDVGCENPLVGLGPGGFAQYNSYDLFSHCTYTELFANSGLFALLIYVYLIFSFIARQFKRYRIYKDKAYLIFLTFGVLYAIYQFFYVFTSDLWLISFFVFVGAHSEIYYSQHSRLSNRM